MSTHVARLRAGVPADLNPDHQVDTLRRAGVAAEDTYIDHASGAKASRPQLDLVLKLLRDGDHAGDHATRPPRQVGAAPDHSRRRAARARVGLRVLEQGLDTAFEYRPCIVLKLAHAFALLPKRQATPQQEDGDGDAERGYRYGEG